jgi:CO/xanthine dehydrogenase FAD-binding subunit
MKKFEHINATTLDEAVLALDSGKAQVIAGGTDLLGTLKDEILLIIRNAGQHKDHPGMDISKKRGCSR